MQMRFKFVGSVLLAATLIGCGSGDALEWTEDVRLPDDRVITLKRVVEFKGPQPLGGTPTESFQKFEFKHPDSNESIKWESHKKDGYLKTVAIWFEQGRPVLLLMPAYGDDKHKFNCPNPPYLLQEFVDKRWQEKPLSKIPISEIRSNMTTHVKELRGAIEKRRYRLTTRETANSFIPYEGKELVPYVVRFEGMPTQTFALENCSYASRANKLIRKGEAK